MHKALYQPLAVRSCHPALRCKSNFRAGLRRCHNSANPPQEKPSTAQPGPEKEPKESWVKGATSILGHTVIATLVALKIGENWKPLLTDLGSNCNTLFQAIMSSHPTVPLLFFERHPIGCSLVGIFSIVGTYKVSAFFMNFIRPIISQLVQAIRLATNTIFGIMGTKFNIHAAIFFAVVVVCSTQFEVLMALWSSLPLHVQDWELIQTLRTDLSIFYEDAVLLFEKNPWFSGTLVGLFGIGALNTLRMGNGLLRRAFFLALAVIARGKISLRFDALVALTCLTLGPSGITSSVAVLQNALLQVKDQILALPTITLVECAAFAFFILIFVAKKSFQTINRRHMVVADDVTQMNSTIVDRIFYPKETSDVQHLVRQARAQKKQISVRGQSHTMGGHTIAAKGYVLDVAYMNKMKLLPDQKQVVVQPGATWGDLIYYLNDFGLSPQTMQSYCSFSIGGTLSVNAHGITNDFGMYYSVVTMTIVDNHGNLVICSRDTNPELFSLVLGGYGLFGIIVEITMNIVPNTKIELESVKLTTQQFPEYFQKFLFDKSIEIKLSRLNISTADEITLFMFRRQGEHSTVSDITPNPREMSVSSRLLYKWILPINFFQRVRFLYEDFIKKPLDWQGENDRNLLMYESAVPLARLYQPLIFVNHTFILQEYFIPKENFSKFMSRARPCITAAYKQVTLLNLTIRYLQPDNTTFLPYAPVESYAFVLYFRLTNLSSADDEIRRIHNILTEITLSLNGTFYVPYRHHYTDDQLQQAYPNIQQFFDKKDLYDPENLFSNSWYQRYARKYRETDLKIDEARQAALLVHDNLPPALHTEDYVIPIVAERRNNSYETVVDSRVLRRKFQQFLKEVFNIEDETFYAVMANATWNPVNEGDIDVYRALQSHLQSRAFNWFHRPRNLIKSLIQLRRQKKELLEQTELIVKNLGLFGHIHDYASFGDSGKMVIPFRDKMGIKGNVYILNDQQGALDFIERGSIAPVGTFVQFDFAHITTNTLSAIPPESIGLVTLNMGLHHFHQDELKAFLQLVWKILRPGGLFIFREHDATPELIPLLDLAHSVFNVITGVSLDSERHEIRAFRSVQQWCEIVTSEGFQNVYLYGLEKTDPTEDYMLTFMKPANTPIPMLQDTEIPKDTTELHKLIRENTLVTLKQLGVPTRVDDSFKSYYELPEWFVVVLPKLFSEYLEHIPFYRFPYLRYIKLYWTTVALEFRTVYRKRGLMKAFGNGFAMTLGVGFVTTWSFLQLQLLSIIPLIQTSFTPIYQFQHLIVTTPKPFDWQAFEPRITARLMESDLTKDSVYYLDVPCHTAFIEIMLKMATIPQLQLLEISGQNDDMQIQVIVEDLSLLPWLHELDGCEVLFTFQFPTQVTKTTNVAMSVQIPKLFSIVNRCQEKGLRVTHVFDFN